MREKPKTIGRINTSTNKENQVATDRTDHKPEKNEKIMQFDKQRKTAQPSHGGPHGRNPKSLNYDLATQKHQGRKLGEKYKNKSLHNYM